MGDLFKGLASCGCAAVMMLGLLVMVALWVLILAPLE